jgi:protoporphyrinogen oxidase
MSLVEIDPPIGDVDGTERPHVVLGGGPAGLTAGYLLAKAGKKVIVLEADEQVGGIAKTVVDPEGFRFDLGGHRFFTKSKEVNDLWLEIMGDEFLMRPRMSRIFWRGKFLDYPLNGMDVVKKLGPWELMLCGLSYLRASLKRKGDEDNLEQWVSNRFGWRLYSHFFKGYTEKVWGVSTTELRAEWAAQRIKGLSFWSAAKSAFVGNKDNKIKSLIDKFQYPRYGPGQMWEMMTERIEEMGGEVRLNTAATKLDFEGTECVAVHTPTEILQPASVISSLPLAVTASIADPAPAPHVVQGAKSLRYRDFLTVSLIIDGEDLFPDNWIYIHEDSVEVGRIQNFRSWSPWMVPDPDKASIGMEYFVFEGDEMWNKRDEDLVALATRELEQLGLSEPGRVHRGYVVRVPKAYPMYDEHYAENVAEIRTWLDPMGSTFQQVGRNGLHRYNNSDHSMLSAMRAVDNVLNDAGHDIWAVNVESSYHEEQTDADNVNPYKKLPEPVAAEAAA